MLPEIALPTVLTNSSLCLTRDRAVVASPAFAGFDPLPSTDGKTLLTAGYDGTLQFWSVGPNRQTKFLDALRVQDSSTARYKSYEYCLSSDGKEIAIASLSGLVQVWRRTPLEKVADFTLSDPVYDPLLVDSNHLLYNSKGVGWIRDISSGVTVQLAMPGPFVKIPKTSFAVGVNGLINLSSAKLVRRWKSKINNYPPISLSPDGKYVIIAGEDPTWTPPSTAASEAAYARTQSLRVWRVSDGKLIKTLRGFWTYAQPDQAILWTSRRSIRVPGLGWEKNVLTGKTVKSFNPEKNPSFPTSQNVVRLKQTIDGRERFETVVLPELGVQMLEATRDLSGGLEIYRHPKRTFSTPSAYVGSASELTRLDPDGRLSSSEFNLDTSAGELAVDANGPYSAREILFHRQDLDLFFKLSARPANSGTFKWDVERIVMKDGNGPDRSHLTKEARNPLPELISDAGSFPFYGVGQGALSGDSFLHTSPMRPDSLTCLSLSTGKSLWTHAEPNLRIGSTSISLSKDWFAFYGEESQNSKARRHFLFVGKAQSGEFVYRIPCQQLSQTRFSPDGQHLAVIGYDTLAVVDLTSPQPSLLPLNVPTNPMPGDLNDAHLKWIDRGRRLLVVNSLRPIQLVDTVSRCLVATLMLFDDDTWLALGANEEADGSPSRISQAKIWAGDHWSLATRSPGFFFRLLND